MHSHQPTARRTMKIINHKIMKVTSITDLHEYIILSILCFLSANFIIRCRCVCKDWANLICQPYFPYEYFSRRKAPVQLVINRSDNLFLVQLDKALNPTIIDINIRRIFRYGSSINLYIIACQVTGWMVSFRYKYTRRTQLDMRYHVYNPVTGQHIVVPQPKRYRKHWHGHALIFAQKTNQLKLLEFCCNVDGEQQEAHIRTIGTDTWRSIGEVPCQHHGFHQPVLLNGHCHWFDINKCLINSFNVEEEVFDGIYETPSSEYYLYPAFGLLHGCLCLTTHDLLTEVWVMKEYGVQDSWTKTFAFTDIPFVKSLTCLENGEILMVGDHVHYRENKYATVICYNPRSGKSTRVNIHDEFKEEKSTRVNIVKEVEKTLPRHERKKKTRKHKVRGRIFQFL